MSTTAEEVLKRVDLSGKHVFVTGVSSGIGVATARVEGIRGGERF